MGANEIVKFLVVQVGTGYMRRFKQAASRRYQYSISPVRESEICRQLPSERDAVSQK